MSLYVELDTLNLEQLIARFQSPPIEGEEYATVYYQELAHLIRQQGQSGIDFLKNELKQVDTERLQGILFALATAEPKEPDLKALFVSYLKDERPAIVAAAIDGLCYQGEKAALAPVVQFLEHPSSNVRGSVLRFIARLHPERALPMLKNALHDPAFIVRENAVDELADLEAVDAMDDLRPLLNDAHPHVRQAAQTALATLEAASADLSSVA